MTILYDALQFPVQLSINLFSLLTALFAVLTIIKLNNKEKTPLALHVKHALTFVAIGFIIVCLAELTWTYLLNFAGIDPQNSLPDLFWMLGYAFILFGILRFSSTTKQTRWPTVALACAIFSVAIAVTTSLVIPTHVELLELFIIHAYPTISTTLATLTFFLYATLHEKNALKPALLLLGFSFIANIPADIIFAHIAALDTYGLLGAISDSLYAIAGFFSTISFIILSQAGTP